MQRTPLWQAKGERIPFPVYSRRHLYPPFCRTSTLCELTPDVFSLQVPFFGSSVGGWGMYTFWLMLVPKKRYRKRLKTLLSQSLPIRYGSHFLRHTHAIDGEELRRSEHDVRPIQPASLHVRALYVHQAGTRWIAHHAQVGQARESVKNLVQEPRKVRHLFYFIYQAR